MVEPPLDLQLILIDYPILIAIITSKQIDTYLDVTLSNISVTHFF